MGGHEGLWWCWQGIVSRLWGGGLLHGEVAGPPALPPALEVLRVLLTVR